MLELISKILNWGDDQKAELGLVQDQRNLVMRGTQLVGGLIGSLVGAKEEDVPEVAGSSLSELWVNYLMHEATDESDQTELKG